MTGFHVIIYTSLTVVTFIIIFILFYWLRTRKVMKQSQGHGEALRKELKPGMKVIFAGGLIGTFKSVDDDNTIAMIELSPGNTIEVAFYSITSILI